MGFHWVVAPQDVFPDAYRNYTQTVMTTGNQVAEQRAAAATAWMKENAPWTDRTGNARAGLHVEVEQDAEIIAQLTFSHGEEIDYGIWLEIANGGQYAIIAPAIDYWAPILMRDMQNIANLGLVALD